MDDDEATGMKVLKMKDDRSQIMRLMMNFSFRQLCLPFPIVSK